MRRKVLFAALTVALAAGYCLAGCSDEKKAGKPTTEKVDEFANEAKDSLGDNVSLPSESVTKVISDTWKVPGTEEVYVLNTDGTGTKDGSPFTFECGFDDENNITLHITMEDTGDETLYAISTDETGYGIDLTSLDGGEDLRFLPADLEFLDIADERAAGILGEWSDESGNRYIFDEDNKVTIKSSAGDTEGTFSVVADGAGDLFFRIAVEGGSLEYRYTLSEDAAKMDLVSPGTDIVHRWTKE